MSEQAPNPQNVEAYIQQYPNAEPNQDRAEAMAYATDRHETDVVKHTELAKTAIVESMTSDDESERKANWNLSLANQARNNADEVADEAGRSYDKRMKVAADAADLKRGKTLNQSRLEHDSLI